MSLFSSDIQRVDNHWSEEGSWKTGRGLFWLELPAVQRRLSCKVSGQPDTDWIQHTVQCYFAGVLPLDRCLSLGCGEGALERQLAELGVFCACDAIDVAYGSVARASALAQQSGYDQISYAVKDANTLRLPPVFYDAVWASGAVHHFERLEHVFDQVAAALKPGGLFVLNEYVGPSRFQFPIRQQQAIQACNELLPLEYRRIVAARLQREWSLQVAGGQPFARRLMAKMKEGGLIPAVRRRVQALVARRTGTRPLRTGVNLPTASSVAAVDPSEAVRSAEIMPLLRERFEILEYRPLGGAILQFLLADIAGNFESEEGNQLLEMLFTIEDTLMARGDLESDFAYIVATPLSVRDTSGRSPNARV